jgi:hypothetical protein
VNVQPEILEQQFKTNVLTSTFHCIRKESYHTLFFSSATQRFTMVGDSGDNPLATHSGEILAGLRRYWQLRRGIPARILRTGSAGDALR